MSHKVAQKLLQKGQKLLFVTKVAPTKKKQTTKKNKNILMLSSLFELVQKYANCTTKVRFLSIFVQFCGVTSVAKSPCPQLKPNNA